MPIHPIKTTDHVRNTYLRYLKTIKPFQDDILREQFSHAIEEPEMLVKGPLLQISLPYEKDLSIHQLVDEGVLSPKFKDLCSDALPYDRPLYKHQVRAIRKAVSGRNIVVSTGTGSGKTESFLIPVLNHLLREEENGTIDKPGVRALLMYPMNALANDQMKRLRKILKNYGRITFGRYINVRETPYEPDNALERFKKINKGKEPNIKNELKSRIEMHENPPHILLTNYAMLEYLLLRPEASPLFDGDFSPHWKFIAIDEAHVYDGSNAIEISMLLRRLQDRVAGEKHGKIQGIATSATIGRGKEDFHAVAEFASKLFNKGFGWDEFDHEKQDIIGAETLPINELGEVWGSGTAELYADLSQLLEDNPTLESCEAILRNHHISEELISNIRKQLEKKQFIFSLWLYHLLRGDNNIHQILTILIEKPTLISELSQKIFSENKDPDEMLVNLVNLAVYAKPDTDEMPLLPARYHVFARALEGAFICLNKNAEVHKNGAPRLFLTRQKFCPHCQSRVFELANCTRCGTEYIVGQERQGLNLKEDDNENFKINITNTYLIQDSHLTEAVANTSYFVFVDSTSEEDEDERIANQTINEDDNDKEALSTMRLCPICGQVQSHSGPRQCSCSSELIKISRVDLGRKKTLRRCISCSTRSSGGVVYRFLTGQDAPVSVLAGALYQHIPPSSDEDYQGFPGNGRKMLNFTDSRQNAAFFAPYMERTHMRNVRRGLVFRTIVKLQSEYNNEITLEDLIEPLKNEADSVGLFDEKISQIQRSRMMAIWLMQEFTPLDRRMSLEGLGLIHFEPKFGKNATIPNFLTEEPLNLSKQESQILLIHLLNTLRKQGAVTYLLPDQNIYTDDAFLPRNLIFYVRKSDAAMKSAVYSWLPTEPYSNARLDYMMRILEKRGIPTAHRKEIANRLLNQIWEYITAISSPWENAFSSRTISKNKIGVIFQINVSGWTVKASGEELDGWMICDQCKNTYYGSVNEVCQTYCCKGNLEPLEKYKEIIESNLYRQAYLYDELIPLSAQEHTAQWTSEAGAEVQNDFVNGKINLLSCSTTFELGVDVGDLQSVLMRNVPPTTANYVQRSGRAGRRSDSAAYVLTFAQRSSHDLTYYADPVKMVAGEMKPPYVSLHNEKVLRRHLHSVVFSEFFRWAKPHVGIEYKTTGEFFTPIDGAVGKQLLISYLDSDPEEVKTSLNNIFPADMLSILGISNDEWREKLTNIEENAPLDLAMSEITEELDFLDEEITRLWQQVTQTRNTKLTKVIDAYERMKTTIFEQSLLGFLGSRNVLPKYGFPTDLVELRTNHLSATDEAQKISLSRGLKIAISEFAPGSEVVAAKKVWVGGGLKTLPKKTWPTYKYSICKQCGKFFYGQSVPTMCNACNEPLSEEAEFIKPQFGFVASLQVRNPGEQPPKRTYAGQVYFTDYQEEASARYDETTEFDIDPKFKINVFTRYSRFGEMAVVNQGIQKRGFMICPTCGWAEVISYGSTNQLQFGAVRVSNKKSHNNPITGKACEGGPIKRNLGHTFLTDVFEIKIQSSDQRFYDRDKMNSLMYALLDGASETVGIRRSDIDGTLFYRKFSDPQSIIIFDDVPGGAGHVKQISKKLYESAELALNKVESCSCGLDTSCYSCLRNYNNQNFHETLRRKDAIELLTLLLNGRFIE